MWHLDTRAVNPRLVVAHALRADARALAFADVVRLWRDDPGFRRFWTDALRAVPFAAFCWECPPLTAAGVDAAFECVFVDSPLLVGSTADPAPFAAHFRAGEATATFASLGGDAVLVAPAPAPVADGTDAAHLAAFVATCGDAAADRLWHAVGAALAARLGASPVWLSTAGLGVSWLHVRLDTRPKYYRHDPYRRVAACASARLTAPAGSPCASAGTRPT